MARARRNDDRFRLEFSVLGHNDLAISAVAYPGNDEVFDVGALREHLIDTIMSRFKRETAAAIDPLMRRWSYIYCLNGTFGMMRDWISQDFPMGDREFAELVLLMGFRASGFSKCSDRR